MELDFYLTPSIVHDVSNVARRSGDGRAKGVIRTGELMNPKLAKVYVRDPDQTFWTPHTTLTIGHGGIATFNANPFKHYAVHVRDSEDRLHRRTWKTGFRTLFRDEFNHKASTAWETRGTEYVDGTTRARASDSAVELGEFLKLKTIIDPENAGGWLNGHIGTLGRFEFTYGWAAVRARVQPHPGSHCSLWLQTTEDYIPGQAEVDVFEYFGAANPDRPRGVDVHHNVYWREDGDGYQFRNANLTTNSNTLLGADGHWYEAFHTFAVNWRPDRYEFWVDGHHTGDIYQGLSNRPKFLALSMLTRDYEAINMDNSKIDSYVFDVDWCRVWKEAN